MESKLREFTVVDFTEGDYGVVCGSYLAMFGMNVIYVTKPLPEPGKQPDPYRFIMNNISKKCVTLDTDTDKGRRVFEKMIRKADVLIENRPYDYMETLGFGYEQVKEINPTLIYASMKPYPEGYEWQQVPATNTTISAMSGASYINGYAGYQPLQPGQQIADTSTSALMATGILSALYKRMEDGRGRKVSIDQLQAIIAHGRSAYFTLHMRGYNVRVGNASPSVPDYVPMDLYPTREGGEFGFALVGISGEKSWKPLCEAIGRPELFDDPRFATWKLRLKNIDELNEIICEYTRKHTKKELMNHLLKENRVLCGAVNSISDLLKDQALYEAGTLQRLSCETVGTITVPTYPVIYDDSEDCRLVVEDPGYSGAANEAILGGFLSLDAEEMTELARERVI